MGSPGYELGVLFQDTGGRKVDPSKAFWAKGAADSLLKDLEKLEKKGEGDPTTIEEARDILNQLAKHFETLGKSGLTQGQARKKAIALKGLFACL